QDGFDIFVCVLENQIPAAFKMLPFPIMLKFLESVQHRKEPEIHGSHIQRGQFGFEDFYRLHALFYTHVRTAAGSDVDDGLSGSFDLGQKWSKMLGILGWPAVSWMTRMQMQNGCACLRSLNGRFCNFV